MGPGVRMDDVREAVELSFRAGFGGSWTRAGYDASEIEAADRLEKERYARDTWTWRR